MVYYNLSCRAKLTLSCRPKLMLSCRATQLHVHTIKLSHWKSIQSGNKPGILVKMSTKHAMLWLFMIAQYLFLLPLTCCYSNYISLPYTLLSILCHILSCSWNYMVFCAAYGSSKSEGYFRPRHTLFVYARKWILPVIWSRAITVLTETGYAFKCFADCMDKHKVRHRDGGST